MADKTGIAWTQATWNPVVGCSRVSPGCDNCYAIRDGARLQHLPAYAGTIADGDWTGLVRCLPERLEIPLRWKRPRLVFVNSMSDLFHPDVPDEFIGRVFDVMWHARQHDFQVLTKRPQRMAALLPVLAQRRAIGTNVWLGTSIESGQYGWRANHLRQTPATTRFLSLEPLVGPIEEDDLDLTAIDWVIIGGESGPKARPLDVGWVRAIRDRAHEAGAAVFVKQLGSVWAEQQARDKGGTMGHRHAADPAEWSEDLRVQEYPSAAWGRVPAEQVLR